MKPVCTTDVQAYAQKYLSLSELPSVVNRCDGNADCLVRKINIQRTFRANNNYQSFLLYEYLSRLIEVPDVKDNRRVAFSFAFLKYIESESRWYLAQSRDSSEYATKVHVTLAEVWEQWGRAFMKQIL